MPIKDDGVVEYVEINGEQIPKIVVPAEITITNTETGQEYGSAKEADDDVANPATATKAEHIRQDVVIKAAIHEILEVNTSIREMIFEGKSEFDIKDQAIKNGMTPLREAGIDKINAGISTVEEILRATVEDN